jgi:histone deacetylase 6
MASLYYEYLSLYVSPSTTECAKLSCGCAIEAALAVARGEVANSLAIIRPPGHHAEPSEHMGFCFFNNVAVAARVVRAKTNLKKILIVDWYAPLPLHASLITDMFLEGMCTTVRNIFKDPMGF